MRSARYFMILAILIYANKCFWLAAYLSVDDAEYSPTVILHLIEVMAFMFIGTLAVLIARQKEFSKKQWMHFDLLFMFIAALGLIGTVLRGFDIFSKESGAIGIVVTAVILGHKFAKFTCAYCSEPNQTVTKKA